MNFSHKCGGKRIWEFPIWFWDFSWNRRSSYWGTSIYGNPQIQLYQRNDAGTRRLNCYCGASSTRGACPCHGSCQPCYRSHWVSSSRGMDAQQFSTSAFVVYILILQFVLATIFWRACPALQHAGVLVLESSACKLEFPNAKPLSLYIYIYLYIYYLYR